MSHVPLDHAPAFGIQVYQGMLEIRGNLQDANFAHLLSLPKEENSAAHVVFRSVP